MKLSTCIYKLSVCHLYHNKADKNLHRPWLFFKFKLFYDCEYIISYSDSDLVAITQWLKKFLSGKRFIEGSPTWASLEMLCRCLFGAQEENREAGGRSGQRIKKDEHRLVGGNGFRNVGSTPRPRSMAEDLKFAQAGHLAEQSRV